MLSATTTCLHTLSHCKCVNFWFVIGFNIQSAQSAVITTGGC